MHLLPIILAAWSHKQRITEGYLASLPQSQREGILNLTGDHRDSSDNAVIRDNTTGEMIVARETNALIPAAEFTAIQARDLNDTPTCEPGELAIRSSGTDAWESLMARLSENGVHVDADQVAALSAGFFVERWWQKHTGESDPQALHDELVSDLFDADGKKLFDAKWARDLEAHPNREAIAAECYSDLSSKFPLLLKAADIEPTERAIGFDPNVVEVVPCGCGVDDPENNGLRTDIVCLRHDEEPLQRGQLK